MEEDEDFYLKPFDYFNSDINLLTLHILLEGYYRGQNILTLEQFLKGEYWKIEEITEEVQDTNDYGSVEDLVLRQVVQITRDLKLGKIKRISVTDLDALREKVIREALNNKECTEDTVMYYTGIIKEISDLDKLQERQREAYFRTNKKATFGNINTNGVNFTENDFHRYIQYISSISAPFIEIEIDFDQKGVDQLNKDIDDLLFSFSQDDFIDKKPIYKSKRFYFSKQLENFFGYIKALPEIDGCVNIPFSALLEQGFEVIKIMSYLERETRIKVRNWNDTELWNVKFHQTPITLPSLLGQVKKDAVETEKTKGLKLNLSFSSQTGTMTLSDQEGKEYKVKVQGQVQKEVLRVIFQNPKNTYTEWSLYDISELLGGNDVNETAVKNAIYQFNRKVKLSIPEVENIFELTKHSARLNTKYINKN